MTDRDAQAAWRAQCHEIAAKHAAMAIADLTAYLASHDPEKLGTAQRRVDRAMRNATQPFTRSGGPVQF